MKLLFHYIKINLLQLFRNRSAAFFSIAFPVLLVLVFGHRTGNTEITRIGAMIVFCNYAVQTSTFLSLGLSVSAERSSDWMIYLKTLPAKPHSQFIGLIVSKLVAAFISLILVVLSLYFIAKIHPSIDLLFIIIIAAFLGGIPMALLGIALGYRVNPAAARGIMVFLNLSLLFGAFAFPQQGTWSFIRDFVPSYQWMMISLSHVEPTANSILPWVWLIGWTMVFYAFAVWSHHARRDLRRE
jgi:ABC-2 type transport system permease protein